MSANNEDDSDAQLINALVSAGFDDLSMVREIADVLVDPSEFADLIGVSHAALEELIYDPELMSIVGRDTKLVGLLQKVNITSVAQLGLCNPSELCDQMEFIAKQYPVGSIPKRVVIAEWVEQAWKASFS